MKLNSENVEAVLKDCLFKEGEDMSNPVIAEGVMQKFGFHKERLESHAQDIADMLSGLPNSFHADGGGGMSFLNACTTEEGDQWGEHTSIDNLLCLGIASGQAKILFPRGMWSALPGGLPYFVVGIKQKSPLLNPT